MSKPRIAVIGEIELEPSFRTASRIVALKQDGKITFVLQFQHEGEPGAWITEGWLPWHAANFNAIIRGAAKYHHLIERIIQLEKSCSIESPSQNNTPKKATTRSFVTNKP